MTRRRVSSGAHTARPGACAMEWVWLIRHGHVSRRFGQVFVHWSPGKTDSPECTLPLITHLVLTVNDASSQEERDQLARLIPRILRAGPGRTLDEGLLLNNRLVLRVVGALIAEDDPNREVMLDRLATAERALVEGRPLQPSEVAGDGNEYWKMSLVSLAMARALREALRVSRGSEPGFMVLSGTLHRTLDQLPAGQRVPFIEAVLDQYEKVAADLGMLGDDPEDDYIEDDVLAELIEELSGGTE